MNANNQKKASGYANDLRFIMAWIVSIELDDRTITKENVIDAMSSLRMRRLSIYERRCLNALQRSHGEMLAIANGNIFIQEKSFEALLRANYLINGGWKDEYPTSFQKSRGWKKQ